MSHPDAEKWNAIYAAGGHAQDEPVKVLKEFPHLLSDSGTALDLACGRGANALFLAKRGLNVHAWDISEMAIATLNAKAKDLKLKVDTCICDVTTKQLPADYFDVIVVGYFLERKLMPAILNALRNKGLLFYQTFIRDKIEDVGPKNNDYRLARNELLQLCSGLDIILYHEEGLVGDTSHGFRNEAMLIGQRYRD